MNTTTQAADGFLRLPQVLERIPVSRSGWWKGVKEGRFPQPVKLSPRVTVWRASDVQAFIEATANGVK
jgi:predicted DNA-binding transcriptional regulator AlpA